MTEAQRFALARKYRAHWEELEWRKCRDDFEYFCKTYWYISTPGKARLFELRPAQIEGYTQWDENLMTVTLKSRQVGWSTLVAAWVFHKVFFFDEPRLVIMLSDGLKLAIKLLRHCLFGFDRLPAWMKTRGPKRTNRSSQIIEFDTGSIIESMPSKSDPARGSTAWAIVVDEWASHENPEDGWASIEPVVDIGQLYQDEIDDIRNAGGRVVAFSTPKGSGNFFHSFWVNARNGTNGFHPIFIPWDSVPERTDDWYEDKKARLPSWQLHQEYVSDEDLAFIKSGNPVFDHEDLAKIEPAEPQVGTINRLTDGLFTFRKDPDGKVNLYKDPALLGEYVIGADVAQGLSEGDFSSADVIRLAYWDDGELYPAEQVAHFHGHVHADQFAYALSELGLYYGTALLAVEANAHGQSTLNELKRHIRYPRLYYRRIAKYRKEKRTEEMGFWTSKATKPAIIDDMIAALRDETLIINDRGTKQELSTFVRSYSASGSGSPSMHGSPYDDRVMSISIANHISNSKQVRQPSEVQMHTAGITWNDAVKELRGAQRGDQSWRVIGR